MRSDLDDAIHSLPAGRWAVAVSGGADSVALLSRLRGRGDLSLHVVHLDHQTRGQASSDDAKFVAELASKWNLPVTIARRDQIEPQVENLPTNPSARFRKLRLALFASVVADNELQGVILAHHADDQAETVLHRLLRSSGATGLTGMSPITQIGSLVVLRPLLQVRREQLTAYLREFSQPWRTDASNESSAYMRNRLRGLLRKFPALFDPLIDLSVQCRCLRDWIHHAAPRLEERFAASRLAELPDVLAGASARRWLAERGAPKDEISDHVIHRLLDMSRDAASPPRQHFPGHIPVRRRHGVIFVD